MLRRRYRVNVARLIREAEVVVEEVDLGEVVEGDTIGVTAPRMVGDDTAVREEVEVWVCAVVRRRVEVGVATGEETHTQIATFML